MRKNNKGFTLIEMLIVVAIIAILVVVSIPLVNSSLERARVATDAANERAAKAEAVILYLNGTWDSSKPYYDVVTGQFSSSVADGYGKCKQHTGGCIKVELDEDTGNTTVTWAGGASSSTAHAGKVEVGD